MDNKSQQIRLLVAMVVIDASPTFGNHPWYVAPKEEYDRGILTHTTLSRDLFTSQLD